MSPAQSTCFDRTPTMGDERRACRPQAGSTLRERQAPELDELLAQTEAARWKVEVVPAAGFNRLGPLSRIRYMDTDRQSHTIHVDACRLFRASAEASLRRSWIRTGF